MYVWFCRHTDVRMCAQMYIRAYDECMDLLGTMRLCTEYITGIHVRKRLTPAHMHLLM
jgi:hypothetical protein